MSARHTHLSVDEFVDLANGLMDREQAAAAMAHVRACTLCEEGIREVNRTREFARAKVPNPRRSRRRALVPLGLLAAAILASIMFWPRPSGDTQQFWLPVENGTVTRGANGTVSDGYAEALAAYARKDAREAMRRLDQAEVPPGLERERLLYLASAQQLLGECEACLGSLEAVDVSSLPQPARDRARWIRYLCLRHTGQDERAEELLSALVDAHGEIGALARAERERLSVPPR